MAKSNCLCASNSGVFVVIFGGALVATLSGQRHASKDQDAKPETPPPAVTQNEPPAATDPMYMLDFTMTRIDGEPQDLKAYEGRVVLVVNTASRCGLTPQYEALEKLYRQKKDKGLVILGFPANNFGAQEPGSNDEIREFCSERYEVSFPMFAKISVKGEDAHPFYKKLAAAPIEVVGAPEPATGGEPRWNFAKFLIDRSGRLDSRYFPRVSPDDPRLVERIDELLAREG